MNTMESGDYLAEDLVCRVAADVDAAVRRKPAHEERLAGAVRELLPHSGRLRGAMEAALETLTKRGSFQRPLYAAGSRALAALDGERTVSALAAALGTDDSGGFATLSAACFSRAPALAEPLARVVVNRPPHLVFAAEVARVARGESNGQHVASVAPKIKESHRISLCGEVFVPLLWAPPLSNAIAPALAVLRDAERHLGRWLVLAELGARAGDDGPLAEARARAQEGPASARAAWTMVAWSLDPESAEPSVRPNVELVARLSDRPSADRDSTFLHRLGQRGVASARPMLDSVVKGRSLGDETAVRCALYLMSHYGRHELERQLQEAARSARREGVRGLAVAALYDAGCREQALDLARELAQARQLTSAAWAALVLIHASNGAGHVINEPRYRRIQLGWVE